jgi:putative dimethyl sulfoxide reductase chaperone
MNVQMPLSELTDLLYAREYAYDILRRFFIEEPKQDYLKVFTQQKMVEKFPFIEDSKGIEEGARDVRDYYEKFDIAFNQSHFDDLHWDYTKMMIGPFDLLAPPWESIYVQKEPMLFQKCTMDVRKTYEHFGFQKADYNIEADDHIGLELDFLYHLNNLSLQSAKEENVQEVSYLLAQQEKFINEHLFAFVPELSKKIIENADTSFYVGMAKILTHYLQMDSQVLKELLNIELVPTIS